MNRIFPCSICDAPDGGLGENYPDCPECGFMTTCHRYAGFYPAGISGVVRATQVKPETQNCGGDYPESHGAVIAQSYGFPDSFDFKQWECRSDYLDMFPKYRRHKAKQVLTNGEFNSNRPAELKRFASEIFERFDSPKHVRVVYFYDQESRCGVERIDAVYRKVNA